MTRLLLDTSVLLSGIVGRPTSPPARLLVGMREGAGELLACPTIIRELRAGLTKPYFRQRIRPEEADEVVVAIGLVAIMAPDPVDPPAILRDPTDDFLVAVAHAGQAEAIVSSDRDLLDHAGLVPPALDAHQACDVLGL